MKWRTPNIQRLGFEDEQALLPYVPPSFQGYRLLHEYFALPQRYLFVELGGLGPAVRRCAGDGTGIADSVQPGRSGAGKCRRRRQFRLFCTPAINLFPKRADRIHLSDQVANIMSLPDRTRPLDFEVYQVTSVTGIGAEGEEQEFLPFYASYDRLSQCNSGFLHGASVAAPVVHRQRRVGPRSSYVGSEIYLALVDADEAPYRGNLRQLAVSTQSAPIVICRCTCRLDAATPILP
jgi:type VI secretion system protein ImpG